MTAAPLARCRDRTTARGPLLIKVKAGPAGRTKIANPEDTAPAFWALFSQFGNGWANKMKEHQPSTGLDDVWYVSYRSNITR
jgi:hypothetical protein